MSRRRGWSRAELADVAAGLRRVLEAVGAGGLAAAPGTIARLEGAAAALTAMAEGDVNAS